VTRTALITGVTGQDGSYLAELLVSKGYTVHGLVRSSSFSDPRKLANLAGIRDRITLHAIDLDNHLALFRLCGSIKPDETYHLSAASFVSYTLDDQLSAFNYNFAATHSLISALHETVPTCRFYFAGSSEMFGATTEAPQTELTPFNPRAIYGISKVAGHHLVRNYRERYGTVACTGFLYNHESPRRSYEFVTRKITSTVARIKRGLEKTLTLGNLDAVRDWGYAPDYVDAMWRMLQQPQGDDFVVASGTTHTVRELVDAAFSHVGLDYRDHVVVDPSFFRASEAVPLRGDASKAKRVLGWEPTKAFEAIVAEMVEADLALVPR
jgi:GDPmannose 4,6-dehydratase